MVFIGGRDRALFGWNADTGEFMFAKRYCHGSEISAVDIMRSSGLIVTGSRDKTVKVWTLDSSYSSNGDSSGGSADERPYEPPNPRGRAFPTAVNTLSVGDRVWSLAADPIGQKVRSFSHIFFHFSNILKCSISKSPIFTFPN